VRFSGADGTWCDACVYAGSLKEVKGADASRNHPEDLSSVETR
jgi:hypothetical protein